MFDVSFSELFVIAVVALLVIGPEKLPKVARTAGAFIGRLQRYTAQIKDEVNREMRFEELQRLQREIQSGATEMESSILAPMNETIAEVADLQVGHSSLPAHASDDTGLPAQKSRQKPTKPKQQAELLNSASTPVSVRKPRAKKPASS